MTQLRTIRQRHQLSLRKLAADVGCSYANLSRLETGKQQPSIRLLNALRTRLDLTDQEVLELVAQTSADAAPVVEAAP